MSYSYFYYSWEFYDIIKANIFVCVFGFQHQASHTENSIRKDFKHLHQLLYDEEKAMLAALRKEKNQKTQLMKNKIVKINEELLSLPKTIKELRDKLHSGDVQFLQVSHLFFFFSSILLSFKFCIILISNLQQNKNLWKVVKYKKQST